MMRLFAIVLAAGKGERMGGPKALLDLPGGPLVARHAARLAAAGAEAILVVTRPECVRPLEALALDRVTLIGAETHDPAASLAIAMTHARSLPQTIAIVTPVDAMPASAATLAALLAAVEAGADAAVPTFEGRGGHPIVARTTVLAPYRSSEPPPLRDVLRALGARSTRVAVGDAAVVVNLDTPSEVRAHFAVEPRFFRAT